MIGSRYFYLGVVIFSFFLKANAQVNIDSGYIDVENGKIYYESAGQGKENIVLIHDGLVHHVIWDNQFADFAGRYRVVRYDRRGYGKSPQPEGSFSNIEDLYRVFTALKIEKAVLIGMSAGGGLAIDFTIIYPGKVSHLIVVGAVVGGFTYTQHFLTRGGRLTAADFADREKLLRYFVLEDPYEIAPESKVMKEKLWKIMQANPQNMDPAKNALERIPEKKAIDGLREIKIPVLIIVGEYDIPDVFAHAGAIEAGVENGRREVIRDAGHLVPFEQPEAFNRQVSMFLNGAAFFQALNSEGVAAAVALFNKNRLEDPSWIPFSEIEMNILGYQHLQAGKIKEAIELFKLNVAAYPGSANTYDSLGEAYMNNGDKAPAIRNYKKSLELDPKNTNAIEMLKKLEQDL